MLPNSQQRFHVRRQPHTVANATQNDGACIASTLCGGAPLGDIKLLHRCRNGKASYRATCPHALLSAHVAVKIPEPSSQVCPQLSHANRSRHHSSWCRNAPSSQSRALLPTSAGDQREIAVHRRARDRVHGVRSDTGGKSSFGDPFGPHARKPPYERFPVTGSAMLPNDDRRTRDSGRTDIPRTFDQSSQSTGSRKVACRR